MWLMYAEDLLALEAEYRFWARCQTVDCAALRAGPYARFRRRLVGYLNQEEGMDVKAGDVLRVGSGGVVCGGRGVCGGNLAGCGCDLGRVLKRLNAESTSHAE